MHSSQMQMEPLDRMLSHKRSLNKFKKIDIIQSILSPDNGMKLDINNGRKTGKFTNMQTFLDNQWVKEEILGTLENTLRLMKMKIQHFKTYRI